MSPFHIKIALIYFVLISAAALIATVYDKSAARKGKRRIPERTLFSVAIIGGATAMYLTMLAARHKTRHKRFMLGLPAIIILQLFAVYLVSVGF